jgi:glycosyltransferase involved in cell wall biosynthesis
MRVRFTAWHAYPLFDARDPACVGGAETHAWLLANGLAARPEFHVEFVVRSLARFRVRQFGSVMVRNAGDRFDGLRADVSRSVTIGRDPFRIRVQRRDPRLLWQLPVLAAVRLFRGPPRAPETPAPVYAQTRADRECCFGVSAQSASVVAAAERAGVPSILFLESNSDLDVRFTPESTCVTVHGERGALCRRAIDGATRIVAQHAEQQRLLRERFGRDSVVWPNIIDLAEWDRRAKEPNILVDRLSGGFALWVGRADDFHKRPQLCLELARRLPQVPFVMILNPGDNAIEQQIRGARPDNVTIIPQAPFHWMPALLSKAAVYVSTGSPEYEGSPNLFLQAAASRIPVASLDVSTPLIDRAGAGFCAGGSLDSLAAYVARMTADPAAAQTAGETGRRSVEREHAPAVVIDRLAELLRDVTAP